jgi:hypothetical protein
MTGELPIELVAVICQLRAITRFALANDRAKLAIRCAMRDCLAQLERQEQHAPVRRLAPPGGAP